MESPDEFLAEAHAAFAVGDFQKAEDQCRRALVEAPGDGGALSLLGIALAQAGRPDEAAEVLSQAAAAAPGEAGVHNNLGNALSTLGRLDEAAAAFGRALAIEPGHGRAHNNLATVLKRLGRPRQALRHYQEALSLEPSNAEMHANRANLLAETGRTDEALAGYRLALEIDPASASTHNNLGACLKGLGHYRDAAGEFCRALELAPGYADALSNLGQTLLEQGEVSAAIARFTEALATEPGRGDIHSNLLLALNSAEDLDSAEILAEHRRWGKRFAAPRKGHANDPDPHRPLRVGYLSADLRQHSVAYFIEPVLEAHKGFVIFCYANLGEADQVTERLRGLAATWRDIYRVGDMEAAKRIRGDHIDILLDLAGHTAGNRLGVFALGPAPVQVSWLGYPNSSGLKAIGYRLTDKVADPPGARPHYSERLVRLDGGFLCYRPPADAPKPARSPGGRLTFGSCNNLSKVGPGAVAAWAMILNRVEGSRLFLKSKALGDEGTRLMLAARFADEGVGAERLEMAGWVTAGSHLSVYGGIDIALDTFPYNGTTTTCEALWMGVPVVSLAGDRHAGRVGAALLGRVGLSDLVAKDAGEYVEIAARLAADAGRLDDLRAGLRAMIAEGGLTDGTTFTRGLEAAYRTMWRDWCAGRQG